MIKSGYLVLIVQKNGIVIISFLGMKTTIYLALKMVTKSMYLNIREKEINICIQIKILLELVEVLLKEDSDCMLVIISGMEIQLRLKCMKIKYCQSMIILNV